MNQPPLLSLIIFTPWLGALLLALLRRASAGASRFIALGFSLSTLALTFALLASFDPARTSPQFAQTPESC